MCAHRLLTISWLYALFVPKTNRTNCGQCGSSGWATTTCAYLAITWNNFAREVEFLPPQRHQIGTKEEKPFEGTTFAPSLTYLPYSYKFSRGFIFAQRPHRAKISPRQISKFTWSAKINRHQIQFWPIFSQIGVEFKKFPDFGGKNAKIYPR